MNIDEIKNSIKPVLKLTISILIFQNKKALTALEKCKMTLIKETNVNIFKTGPNIWL